MTTTVTDAQARGAIASEINAEGKYNPFSNNCVNTMMQVLNAAGIAHPDFSMLGIENPSNVVNWINQLTNQDVNSDNNDSCDQ